MQFQEMQALIEKLEKENAELLAKCARKERSAPKASVRESKRKDGTLSGEVTVYSTGFTAAPEVWQVVFDHLDEIKALCAEIAARPKAEAPVAVAPAA